MTISDNRIQELAEEVRQVFTTASTEAYRQSKEFDRQAKQEANAWYVKNHILTNKNQ